MSFKKVCKCIFEEKSVVSWNSQWPEPKYPESERLREFYNIFVYIFDFKKNKKKTSFLWDSQWPEPKYPESERLREFHNVPK